MADGSYLLIYRSMETGDLLDLKDKLVAKMTHVTSMSIGQKSVTRDLSTWKDQLEAIVFVLKERGDPCGYVKSIVFDFGGGNIPNNRAGIIENLSS